MKILFNKYLSKDRLCFVSIGLALLISFLFVIYSDLIIVPSLSRYYVTQEEYDDIISTRKESTSPIVDELYFNSFKLIKDKKSGNWFYSIVEGDINAYNPKISFKKKISVNVASLQKKIETSDIRNNIPLKFIAYDNNSYFIFNVTCTTLPILSVDDTRMYLFDNRTEVDSREFSTYSQMYIRGRGSREFSKKSYTLKLKMYSPGKNKRKFRRSLLGMSVRSKWLLYAAYPDEEKIRQVFSSKIWQDCCSKSNSFDVYNGFEYKAVELFRKGKYVGLYFLGYSIDNRQMRLAPGEYIYKKSAPYEKFQVESGIPKTTNIDDVNEYLKLLKSKDRYKTMSKLTKLVDMDNAIDFWLFINLIQSADSEVSSQLNNMIMTKKFVDTKGNYKFLFTPWDFDFTWGSAVHVQDVNFKRYEIGTKHYTPKDNIEIHRHVVYYLLINKDKGIKKLIKQRYSKLKETVWNPDYMMTLIDKYEKEIFDSGVYIRNKKLWPKGFYLKDSAVKLSLFRKYVIERLKYFDLYIEEITKD